MTEGTFAQFADILPDATEEPTFVCPGESVPVSRAVHLARLAAGWPGCADCIWQTENAVVPATIRRTESGVRGLYLNAIDRFRAAQLAAILSTHLSNLHAAKLQADDQRLADASGRKSDDSVTAPPAITLAVGFDGRKGTPDLFSGVVSAIRQNGCDVFDAGQTSAAGLLNVCRDHPQVFGAVLVTGANGATSEVGLDLFLSDGQTIAIPWQDFGVRVRVASSPDERAQVSSMSGEMQRTLDRIRLTPEDAATTAAASVGANAVNREATLLLPDLNQSAGQVFRSHRKSGRVTSVKSEAGYRTWLLRWWPRQCHEPLEVVANDELTLERLRWLTKRLTLNLTIRCSVNSESPGDKSHASATTQRQPVLTVGQDDRFLLVQTSATGGLYEKKPIVLPNCEYRLALSRC